MIFTRYLHSSSNAQ